MRLNAVMQASARISNLAFLPSLRALVAAVRRTARALFKSRLKTATAALRRTWAQLRALSACFFSCKEKINP